MATEVKIKELSMNDLVWGKNKQVQKVSLKSETMREKFCSIFTENCSKSLDKYRAEGYLLHTFSVFDHFHRP